MQRIERTGELIAGAKLVLFPEHRRSGADRVFEERLQVSAESHARQGKDVAEVGKSKIKVLQSSIGNRGRSLDRAGLGGVAWTKFSP